MAIISNYRKKGGGILCNGIRIFKVGLRYSFICQSTSISELERRNLFGFESNCLMLLPVDPLLGRGNNPVKSLVQRHNKRTCRPIFTLSLFYAQLQAGKLWIPTFKVFWTDSAMESNPGLSTFNTK